MRIQSTYSHRRAEEIIQSHSGLKALVNEIKSAIEDISDEELKKEFMDHSKSSTFRSIPISGDKSLSKKINRLISTRLIENSWANESNIFQMNSIIEGEDKAWRLDFAKVATPSIRDKRAGKPAPGVAVEVSFNHGEALAWNLIKPVISAELNPIPKETDIGEGIGVIICATYALKVAGGFDNAVGSFEKAVGYLKPLHGLLTAPLLLIGIDEPESFHIGHVKPHKNGNTKKGVIIDGSYSAAHGETTVSRESLCLYPQSDCFTDSLNQPND